MKRCMAYLLTLMVLLDTGMAHGDTAASNQKPGARAVKTVLVPLAQGFEDTEAIPLISVLRRAGAKVTLAGLGAVRVVSAGGVTVLADCRLEECRDPLYELIALPGGMPAAQHLHDNALLRTMLLAQQRRNKLYAAICASPVAVLKAHGLLEGKHATCYPALADQLTDPSWADQAVVRDGNCITSQGPGTTLAFALELAEALYGEVLADKLRKGNLVASIQAPVNGQKQ